RLWRCRRRSSIRRHAWARCAARRGIPVLPRRTDCLRGGRCRTRRPGPRSYRADVRFSRSWRAAQSAAAELERLADIFSCGGGGDAERPGHVLMALVVEVVHDDHGPELDGKRVHRGIDAGVAFGVLVDVGGRGFGAEQAFIDLVEIDGLAAAAGERGTLAQQIDRDRIQIRLRVADGSAFAMFGAEQAQIDLLREVLRILLGGDPAPEITVERYPIFGKFLRP